MKQLIVTYQKGLAIFLAILLLVLSLTIDPNLDFQYFRGIRAAISLVFLLLLLIARERPCSPLIVLFFVCHSLSSFLTVWFEQDGIATVSMVINGIGYGCLTVFLHSKLEPRKLDSIILVALILSAIIIGWLSFSFVRILGDYIEFMPLLSAIGFLTLSLFLLSVYGFIYLNASNTGSSVLFIFFVILAAFAETFRGIGYYHIVDSELGQYMARLLLLVAFSFVYFFSFYVDRKNRIQ